MNKEFLYKKAYPLGVIDDTEEDELSSWFLDDSRDILEKKFRECNFHDFIIELIDIFSGGSPNYIQLSILFGFENTEEINHNNTTKISFYRIQRSDIDKIEIDLNKLNSDKSLVICNLFLYVNKLPSLEKISEVYKDVECEENGKIIIHVNGCDIIITRN